ncbi:MAG: hypothetical protein A4E65_00142 [Syntrophorhabdus sp. PtaU1.Bin153]|nr:MAG: hypothetical protein A4E65_00142 [Syntrophorhabdus sp. PtaU1.Bin153]
MRIRIESNFDIPGMHGNELELEDGTTLRQVLGEIARITEGRIEFFRRGSDRLDTEDWEVDLNGVPYHACNGQLETLIADGDVVAVRLVVIGGG